MKKLIFDDLQPRRGDRYEVGTIETNDDAPRGETGLRQESAGLDDGEFHERESRERAARERTAHPAGDGGVTGAGPLHDGMGGVAGREEFSPRTTAAPTLRSVVPSPTAPAAFREEHAPPREFTMSDFFDVDSDIFRGESEPRTEFDFLLVKLLGAVKEVMFAHTVSFFWANSEKQQMVLESTVTDSTKFFHARRFSMGHDLVSRVAISGKPEVVSNVNPDSVTELFPYYAGREEIRSFVGVPVFFPKAGDPGDPGQPVAVIAADSIAEDEFGEETVAMLGHFTKLASALIKSYNDKYDLLLNAELLRSIRRLQEKVRGNFSLATIVQCLADEITKLIGWDHLSIVLYDEHLRCWTARKVISRGQQPFLPSGQKIDIVNSAVGQTIRNNSHLLVDDLEASRLPRYYPGEQLEPQGSFLAVPISSLNKCYGAVTLESRDRYGFSRQDVEMLYRLTENAGSALEILYLNDLIDDYVALDSLTGLYSKKYFMSRIDEEFHRADDSGTELTMLYVSIDKQREIGERYGEEGLERVVLTVARMIRSSVRSYDIIGRVDNYRFGILLSGTTSSEAYLWAEKIRKSIAGHVITVGDKSFSVTISAGVAGVLDGMKIEELMGNTTTVLNRATEAGGNAVRVF